MIKMAEIKRKIKYLLVAFLMFPMLVFSQTTSSYTTAGSFTWTAPCDVTSIQVECWGGGGAGGGATGNVSAGGGGSGGAYIKHTSIPVTPNTTYTITVGAGGTGSTAAGTSGGVSWFSSAATIQAVGGGGGNLASTASSTAAGAVAVTTGNVCNVSGSTSYYGGAGGTGGASGASGGGGGGSAGTGSAGNAGSGLTGGVAVAGGGAGGNGSATGGSGNAGSAPGGAGSGGRANNGTDRSGFSGGVGKVLLTYTTSYLSYCTPTFTSNSEPITNVTFAGVNNTTSGTTGGSAYEQFCSSASVVLGSTGNTISVSGNTDGNYTNYLRLYVDWNHDGDFADSDESFDIGTITNCTSCAASTTISVPCTATVGSTTMRVMKRYGGYPTSSCQTGAGYGQAEDYPITITAEPGSSTPTAQPTSLSLTAVSGSQINGTFTASSPTSGNYLVVRTSTSSAPSSNPVDGTTYVAGNTIGTGTVVSFASATSFSATGLSSNTSYWFWLYSCNGTCSPKYRTTSPLSGTATTMNVINWIGAGAGGAGTDFNTASNWSPATVPGVSDNANITTTTAATITVSANVTVGSLTILNNATGAVTLALDATTKVLTINGDLLANVNASGGGSTILSLRVGNSPGNITVGGTTTLGNNSNTSSYIEVTGSAGGTTTGSFTMKGDTYFGKTYYMYAGYIGSFIWDGTSTQTIYTNDTYSVSLNGSCQIGGTNSPTVNVSSTTLTSLFTYNTAGLGNLLIKAGSTLDLGTKTLNKLISGSSVAGGTLTLEAGAKLRLAATTGGQTGSNFPLNYTTANPVLNATSTVEYYGTGDQTIYDVASPGYGHLTFTNASNKTATSDLDIQGNLLINTSNVFVAGTSLTHTIGGNWTNNGSFSYTTGSTISFTGSANQSIGGTTTTSFNNLTNSNTSTGLTLNRGILVSGTLNMAGATANILLNGYNIDLSSTGTLSGESNTDRIYGTSGVVTTTRVLSNISALDVAGMGCVLTTTANMGSTTISRGHSASSGSGLLNSTILRYYSISPTTNSGLNATLTLNYLTNELNGLSASETDFSLYRSTDGGTTWTKRDGTENAGSNYITLASIDAFSVWTASPGIVVLPISLIQFDGKNESQSNLLTWVTLTESNNDYFTLERSEDGVDFKTITQMDGAGNSDVINYYQFEDQNFRPEINYYRLKQTDYNGQFSFSEIISIDNRSAIKHISKIINLHGQEVDTHYKGVVIIVYTDGSILKTIQNL